MRKLGILVALTAAATLGIAGTASAQQQAPLCEAVDSATQPIIDGGLPLDDTQDGVVDDCMNSRAPIVDTGIDLDGTLCGLEKDVSEVIAPELGEAVGAVHGTLNDIEDAAEAGGLPQIVNFGHPCGGGEDNGDGGGSTVQGASTDPVQAANAAADGGLPRTGGELFAGAGFGLASLGALIRRFLG